MISVGHRPKKIQVKLVKIGPLINNIIIIIIIITNNNNDDDNNNNNSNIIIIILLLISSLIAHILEINHTHILHSCKEKYE